MTETEDSDKTTKATVSSVRPRRRYRVATIVAVCAVVVSGLWWWSNRDVGAPAEPEGVARVALIMPTLAAASAAVAEVATSRSEIVDKDGEVEVCGVGWLSLEGDAEAVGARVGDLESAKQEEVKSQLLPAMLASADETTRAAALAFVALPGMTSSRIARVCQEGRECEEARAGALEAAKGRDALATLASQSSNPQIYAWAVQACRPLFGAEAGGACQLVTADQLARLDPDNAASWELVASEAEARHDDAAVDAAMYRFGMSGRYDVGWGRLPAKLLDSLSPGDRDVVGGWGIAVQAAVAEAVVLPSTAMVALDYCRAAKLVDANRREVCSRIADTMVNHATTMSGHTIGRAVLRRLEGDSPRVRALFDWYLAALETAPAPTVSTASDLGCKTIEGELRRIRDLASMGEVEVAARAIALRGVPPGTLAASYRARHPPVAAQTASNDARTSASVEATSAPVIGAVTSR